MAGTSRDTAMSLAPVLAAVSPLCEQLCPAAGSNEGSEPAPALPRPCSTAQPRATRRHAEPTPFSQGCLTHARVTGKPSCETTFLAVNPGWEQLSLGSSCQRAPRLSKELPAANALLVLLHP